MFDLDSPVLTPTSAEYVYMVLLVDDQAMVADLAAKPGVVLVAGLTAGAQAQRRCLWNAADGSYDAVWQVDKAGKTTVRAILATQAMTTTRTASATATVQGRAITLYRRAKVTWYGPGFYGRRTACGKRMSRVLLGVAHKTLPCGTLVDLYNNGRTVTVPVVDRGPFRPGTSYDLTAATALAIGVRATTTIGAVRSVVSAGR